MRVAVLSELEVRFHTRPDRGRRWRLVRPFSFAVGGRAFEIPAGFWTDFASVPRVVWPVISPYDLGSAPVAHDWGYFSGLESRAFWDEVFLSWMRREGVDPFRRCAAYLAVRAFGAPVWNEYRRDGRTPEEKRQLIAARAAAPEDEVACA